MGEQNFSDSLELKTRKKNKFSEDKLSKTRVQKRKLLYFL
jgi:hypothetical protein